MTEFWAKNSVGFPSGIRRVSVPTLSLAVALSTGATHAGAWEEFQTRCLTPMENVEAPQTVDLRKEEMAEQDGKTATTFLMELPDDDPLFFVIREVDDRLSCGMTNVAIGRTPDGALQDLVNSGKYTLIGGREGEIYVLHSREWREPVLELELRSDGTWVTWIARDTELEG